LFVTFFIFTGSFRKNTENTAQGGDAKGVTSQLTGAQLGRKAFKNCL